MWHSATVSKALVKSKTATSICDLGASRHVNKFWSVSTSWVSQDKDFLQQRLFGTSVPNWLRWPLMWENMTKELAWYTIQTTGLSFSVELNVPFLKIGDTYIIYVYIYIYMHNYTCLLLLISMLWHRQAIFKSKGDKLSSSAECPELIMHLMYDVHHGRLCLDEDILLCTHLLIKCVTRSSKFFCLSSADQSSGLLKYATWWWWYWIKPRTYQVVPMHYLPAACCQ